MLRLLLTLLVLFMTGIFLVSSFANGLPGMAACIRQMAIFSAISLFIAFIGMIMPKDSFKRLPCLFIPAAWIALLLLFLLGKQVNGAISWFRFMGLSIQPSEFAKPAFILLLAYAFTMQLPEGKIVARLHPYAILLLGGIFICPIVLQPDLGTACVFTVTLLIVFASCIRLTYPMAGILVALLGGSMAVIHRFPHAMRRLSMYQDALFLHPDIETAFHNYKLQESVIKGGWFGSGFWPCTGSVNPPLSYSDSFFAATVELLGVISTLPFIFIYLAWFLHCATLAHRATSMANRVIYLAAGSMVTTQSFIHIGVNLGLLPITGLSMPLLGTGGSAFIAFTIIVTMVERLSMLEDEKRLDESDFSSSPSLENA
jgi:Bacterial cell division membrane protein